MWSHSHNSGDFPQGINEHSWKAVAEVVPHEVLTIDNGGKMDAKHRRLGTVAIDGPLLYKFHAILGSPDRLTATSG
ncbi:unnamed protein product [Calypogeia fissa]